MEKSKFRDWFLPLWPKFETTKNCFVDLTSTKYNRLFEVIIVYNLKEN